MTITRLKLFVNKKFSVKEEHQLLITLVKKSYWKRFSHDFKLSNFRTAFERLWVNQLSDFKINCRAEFWAPNSVRPTPHLKQKTEWILPKEFVCVFDWIKLHSALMWIHCKLSHFIIHCCWYPLISIETESRGNFRLKNECHSNFYCFNSIFQTSVWSGPLQQCNNNMIKIASSSTSSYKIVNWKESILY